jgi:hypothetical protein
MYFKCTNLQNNHDHISANVYHVLFRTGEVIGIRASTITLKNDPIGANIILVCVDSK